MRKLIGIILILSVFCFSQVSDMTPLRHDPGYNHLFSINVNDTIFVDSTEFVTRAADNQFEVHDTLYTTLKDIKADSINISASTDSLSVADVSNVFVNTSGGDVTIGGLADGVVGQIVFIVAEDVTNNIILEDDEATGNQDIKTASGNDTTITNEGGATLICDGTYWRLIGVAQ